MGVYALASALVGALYIVQSFGMGSFIIREKELDPEDIRTAFTINAVISVALAAAILITWFITRGHGVNPGVSRVLLVLAVVPLTSIFEILPFAHLERAGRFKLLVVVGMARNLTSTSLTVACAFAGFSYMSLAYGQVAGSLVGVAVLNIVGREHVQLRLSLGNWRRLAQFGAQMLAINGVNSLAERLSDILLGQLLGLSALGLYNRSANVFRLFWDNLHLVIGRVLFVDLAQRKRNGESLRASYLSITQIMTATLWPMFIGLAILSRPLFRLVYGAKWVDAAIPFSLLAVAAVILISISMTWELFTLSGESGRQARIEFVRTGLGLVLFAFACLFNVIYAAAARVIEAAFSTAIYRRHVERMTETQFSDFLPIYARSGILTLLAVGPAAALMIFWRGSSLIPIWQVIASVAAGGSPCGPWRSSSPSTR